MYCVYVHLKGRFCCDCDITFVASEDSALVNQSLMIVEISLGIKLVLTNITHKLTVAMP